ncbi:hypothetical protein [Pandoraea sp. PE-S2R-1]|uniref:hypothetical protein n=1 Tax=Pandoraea sp. PE-S2R-1 TaxID=1986994 RepID=UPI000B401C7B|nr:hypothetical protein [Pandoraea sp. PE-S2R-1]
MNRCKEGVAALRAAVLLITAICTPALAAETKVISVETVLATTPAPSASPAPPLADASVPWEFAITPYLWLPSVGGSLRFSLPAGRTDADTGPYNYLEHLRFALMLQGEARKGDWSLLADGIYLNFGRHESTSKTINGAFGAGETQQSAETSLSGTLIQLGGGYTMVRREWDNVDAVLGVRYLGVEATLDASAVASVERGLAASPAVSASERQNVFDAFVGVRGRALLSRDGRWYVPFYIDVGTGTSRVTWQALSGIGYSAKRVDISLTYRYLVFYGSGDQLVQKLRFNGPSLNVTLRF